MVYINLYFTIYLIQLIKQNFHFNEFVESLKLGTISHNYLQFVLYFIHIYIQDIFKNLMIIIFAKVRFWTFKKNIKFPKEKLQKC